MKLKPGPLYGLSLNTNNFYHCCQAPLFSYEGTLFQRDNHYLFTKGRAIHLVWVANIDKSNYINSKALVNTLQVGKHEGTSFYD